MSARILVVDDIVANLHLLEAKLSAEYYEVITASRGVEGFEKARKRKPDIVLLDVMMPDIDGFEVCRRLKADPETRHIPVVMLTALDQREYRLRGLKAGAEDFLSKPVDDVQLIARVRSLVRLKVVEDELRQRQATGRRIGVIEPGQDLPSPPCDPEGGRVILVDDNERQAARITAALKPAFQVDQLDARGGGGTAGPDLFIVSLHARAFDGLKVIARIRSTETMRHLPVLAVVEPDDHRRAMRALDLGAHDLITRPIDEEELSARVRSLVRRKRTIDVLRQTLDSSLELAVTDTLTGLYNRRYLMGQLQPLVQRAARGGEPVSLFIADVDHFKRVNDTFGHDAGDRVLKELSARIASTIRPTDIACRLGGEEFVIVMPNTTGDVAALAAERMRRHVAGAAFTLPNDGRLDVTVSIGVATARADDESAEDMLRRADEGLYRAKSLGRNRVVAQARSAAA